MKVQKAKCGASVKAAMGGYMKVEKTGYSTGGMAQKGAKAKIDPKDGEKVMAAKGGMMSVKTPKAPKAGASVKGPKSPKIPGLGSKKK